MVKLAANNIAHDSVLITNNRIRGGRRIISPCIYLLKHLYSAFRPRQFALRGALKHVKAIKLLEKSMEPCKTLRTKQGSTARKSPFKLN